MGTFRDLTGERFGRLSVVKRGEDALNTYGRPIVRWECLCECGETALVRASKLTLGRTTSCGCFHDEQFGNARRKHGQAMTNGLRTRAYRSWAHAKNRCTNPKNAKYKDYGARGIRMCERWLNSFENFFADMGEPPPGKSIDRIDNDGHYEQGNCRWATPKEQRANQRA